MNTAAAPAGTTVDQSESFCFPRDFRFGVATAGHQVEGDNRHSDWWDFEQEKGRIKDGSCSGAACEHWHRFEEDLELVTALDCDTYRLSIEWAKVEPERGNIDQSVLQHYREVLLAARARGIEPVVTAYHFVLPRWFSQAGGWVNPDSPELFARYVRILRDALGDQVQWWCTINEPVVYLYHAYLMGLWPPAEHSFRMMVRAGRNLIRGHVAATSVLREKPGIHGQAVQIGIAKHLRVFDPFNPNDAKDVWAAERQAQGFNWAFLDSLEKGVFCFPFGLGGSIPGWVPCQDYVGVNYYTRNLVRFELRAAFTLFGVEVPPKGVAVNELGWELYSDGLYRLLKQVHEKYAKPILITENGIADKQDSQRPQFVRDHLGAVAKALTEGVPVLGYCHWSLYDNFEWAEGFEPRFGLYAVDYATQARTLRQGGAEYARIVRTRTL